MSIPIKLQMLIDEIMELNHTAEEWLDIEKRANKYLEDLTAEQQDYFAESGAGEALHMACSGIRYKK
jgi:hypothetical protein